MRVRRLRGLDRRALTRWLVLFFIALATPAAVLIYQAHDQLKWEAFHRQRVLAEALTRRIDAELAALVQMEEARPFADYSFLIAAGDPAAGFLQRSVLSSYPVAESIPGLIGYFQVDAHGLLTTPLLPAADAARLGVRGTELAARRGRESLIRRILRRNRLVETDRNQRGLAGPPGRAPARGVPYEEKRDATADAAQAAAPVAGHAPSAFARQRGSEAAPEAKSIAGPTGSATPAVPGALRYEAASSRAQAAFEALKSSAPRQRDDGPPRAPTEDRELDSSDAAARERARSAPDDRPALEARRKRRAPAAPKAGKDGAGVAGGGAATTAQAVHTFEGELDPFEFSLLGSGHFVLYRKVWREGKRYIQGALLEQAPFLARLFETAYRGTSLSEVADLAVAYRDDPLAVYRGTAQPGNLASAGEPSGTVLLRTRLSAPLGDLELLYRTRRLPAGPGARVLDWVAGVLAVVLCGGFYLLYRLGAKQIDLVAQQRDFVSAVSHELRTPLTSIRMYGEMLREGWGNEEKKRSYYDYIVEESERLSRLISNVLQLARLARTDQSPDLAEVSMGELMDQVRSKVSSQIERARFDLTLVCGEAARAAMVRVDADYFSQIVINLVDNAIKFAAKARHKSIDITCTVDRPHSVSVKVRDYGPGVPHEQMKKIFGLFYRSEDELTRETAGTGIGLALVHQLAQAMGASVGVVNREPGAEFELTLPAHAPPDPAGG